MLRASFLSELAVVTRRSRHTTAVTDSTLLASTGGPLKRNCFLCFFPIRDVNLPLFGGGLDPLPYGNGEVLSQWIGNRLLLLQGTLEK